MPRTGPVLSQRGRIVLAGAACWIMLGLVFTIGMGWRRFAAGLPFFHSWYDAGHHFVILSLGAVLSPAVVVGLRGLRRRAQTRIGIAAGVVGLGLLYWVSWSLLRVVYMRAVYPVAATDLAFADHYVRALVFSALIALTAYTAMVLIFEAAWYRSEIRERELEAARLQVALDEARSTALRARVDGDLLGDALAGASDVMGRDIQAARTILVSLSELLRVSLRRNGAGMIPLRKEIGLAQDVANIYTSGDPGAETVEMNIDPRVADAGVPAMVLQPAFLGAFRWTRSVSGRVGGRVTLDAEPFGDHLLLVVTARCRASGRPYGTGAERAAAAEALQGRLLERYAGQARVRVRRLRNGGLEIRVRLERPRFESNMATPASVGRPGSV